MRKDWSALKVTLLLYAIIAIFPFSFYFIHSSFGSMNSNSKALSLLAKAESSVQRYAVVYMTRQYADKTLEASVDKSLAGFEHWIEDGLVGNFMESRSSFQESYASVDTFWNELKRLSRENATAAAIERQSWMCLDAMRSLSFTAEKIVLMQQKQMANMLYIEFASMMILILLVIYFVRAYIHLQEKKHAIYDSETRLFNKNYFDAELERSCADAQRTSRHLSVLCVKMNHFEKISDSKQQAFLLKVLGGVFIASVRQSDTVARYKQETFLLILRDTDGSGAEQLTKRIREAFKGQKAILEAGLEFETVVFDRKEMECQSFMSHLRQYVEA